MVRFKLKEDEKLVYKKNGVYWFNIRHITNFGTLYITDKRIVFCATAGWKSFLFPFFEMFDGFITSANIRWEANHNRVRVVDGKGMHSHIKFLTLDDKNTGVAVEEDFIKLLNTFN